VESERSPDPGHAEPAGARGAAPPAAGVSPILGQVGNQAIGRLLETADGTPALQRLTCPRQLARWDWPWKAPQLAPDEPEVVDRDYQLDPNMFSARHADALAKPNPTPPSWVQGRWSTPDFTGEQQASVSEITKRQLYDEIGNVAPGLPRVFKVCLVGHAWVEQQGKNILNFNFGGVEGGSSAYVMGWTSATIPTATYENEPDKSKYRDWDSKGHNPKFGKWQGHDAGTIAAQLEMTPKPAEIVVLVRKRRPAYQSLSHATAAFLNLIQKRIDSLRASTKPEHNQLAEQAFGGDADAYADIVNHRFVITDADGKHRDFGAYNGDAGYYGLVKTSIAATNTELPQ
jgi:hypothetical protein